MSRTATPEDNAYIESFFKTLKKEEIYFKDYKVIGDKLKPADRPVQKLWGYSV